MNARDFNKLKEQDKVVIPADGFERVEPDDSDDSQKFQKAVHGKIVAFFESQVEPATDDKPGKAILKPFLYYRVAKTGWRIPIQKTEDTKTVSSDKIDPYTWAFHDYDLYEARTDFDKLAIADPAGFMKDVEIGNHSWEHVQRLYKAYKREDPPRKSLSHPNGGIQALLDYRSYITDVLIDSLKNVAREDAVLQRQATVAEVIAGRNGDSLAGAELTRECEEFFARTKPPGGNAPGSTEPTSDIDVNTFNHGTEFLVAAFNDNFSKLFDGYEAGIVFDVNVYAKDFLPKFGDDFSLTEDEKATESAGNKPARRFVLPKRDHVFTTPRAEYDDAFDQMGAALLKLRRYTADNTFLKAGALEEATRGAEEWENFKHLVNIITIQRENEHAERLVQLIEYAESQFETNLNVLAATVAFVRQDTRLHVAARRKVAAGKDGEGEGDERSSQTELKWDPTTPLNLDSESPDDLNAVMAAENRIYEVKLATVAKKRNRFDAAKFAIESGLTSKESIDVAYHQLRTAGSDALYFANEAYVTSGAVTQVVGGKQQKSRGVKLTGEGERNSDKEASANIAYGAHELMHSIFDQLADIYKETKRYYEHTKDDGLRAEEQYGGAILKSSKYIHRMFNAIKHLYTIIGIVEEANAEMRPDAIMQIARARYPKSDFRDNNHFQVFRKLGFGLEALKKFELKWDDQKSENSLKNLLEKKFSLKGDDEGGTVTADFTSDLNEVFKKAKSSHATTARIAASAVFKFFSSCLVGDEYDRLNLKNMTDVRKALTRLVVSVLDDFFRFIDLKDEVIAAAMKKAGRPYPRLYAGPPKEGV